MITRFWHVGFAVNDREQGIVEYERLGFVVRQKFEIDNIKALAVHMDHPSGSSIELFEFQDPTHPKVEFIKRHMAFLSDDFDNDLQKFLDDGHELVIPKTVGVTVTYAYIKDSSGNCIEIAEQKNV